MSRAVFKRPDGRNGSYGEWLAEVSAKWGALSMREQHASRDAASERLAMRVKAQADGPALIHLYDEIGYFGVWPADFIDVLSGIKGDIELHLNSPGGDVFDGVAILNALQEHSGQVRSVVDGLAASAASYVAMAADPGLLEIAKNGTIMIHDAWGGCVGPARDMRKMAATLEQQTENIASIYAERTGRDIAEFRQLMEAETWAVGQEAVALGLADRVRGSAQGAVSGVLPVAASLPWQVTLNAKGADEAQRLLAACRVDPAEVPAVVDAATPYTPEPYSKDADETVQCPVCHEYNSPDARFCDQCGAKLAGRDDVSGSLAGTVLNAGGGHAPMTGTHSHGHPAMGDQGDDDTHGHEHSHDDDADHGHGHDPDGDGDVTADAGAVPKASANVPAWLMPDVDESEWDPVKAMADAAAADNPERHFRAICAGRRPGDPDTADAWALPYRYSPDSPPNASGVLAALAQAEQAKGLTNRDEAVERLEKVARWIDPDYDPAVIVDMAALASALAPRRDVDESEWNPAAALAFAAASPDPEAYFRGICAGRLPGNPATADAWALPYRYTPNGPANASGVRTALAELPTIESLANAAEARRRLDTALRAITPDPVPDEEMDTELLSAAFALALKGAGK